MNRIILALALVAGMTASTQATAPTLTLSDSFCSNPSAQFFDLTRQNLHNLTSAWWFPTGGLTPMFNTLTGGYLSGLPLLPNYYNATCFKGLDPDVSKQSGLGLEKWWEVLRGNNAVAKTNFCGGPGIVRHAEYFKHKATLAQSYGSTGKEDMAMAKGLEQAKDTLLGAGKDRGVLFSTLWNGSSGWASSINAAFERATSTTSSVETANSEKAALLAQYESMLRTRKAIYNACRAQGASHAKVTEYLDKVVPLPAKQVGDLYHALRESKPSPLSPAYLKLVWNDLRCFGETMVTGGKNAAGDSMRLEALQRASYYGGPSLLAYYISRKCGRSKITSSVLAALTFFGSYHFDIPSRVEQWLASQ